MPSSFTLCRHIARLGVTTSLCSGCGYVSLDYEDSDAPQAFSPEWPKGEPSQGGETGENVVGGDGGATPLNGSGGAGVGGTWMEPGTGGEVSLGAGGSEATGGAQSGAGGTSVYPGSLFSNDYEGEGGLPAPELGPGASAILTTERSHSGASSLKLSQGTGGEGTAAFTHELENIASSSVYFRAFIYLSSDALPGPVYLVRFGEEGGQGVNIGVRDTARVTAELESRGVTYSSAPDKHPSSEWFCFQVAAHVDDTDGQIEISVNGETVMTTPFDDTQPGAGVNTFSYGLVGIADTVSAATVYFDDVVVDDAPIPCE